MAFDTDYQSVGFRQLLDVYGVSVSVGGVARYAIYSPRPEEEQQYSDGQGRIRRALFQLLPETGETISIDSSLTYGSDVWTVKSVNTVHGVVEAVCEIYEQNERTKQGYRIKR